MHVQKAIRYHDQSAIWIASLCRDDGVEVGLIVNRRQYHLYSIGRCGCFERAQVNFDIWRRCRVEHEGGSVDARRNLLEQLQPFAGDRRLHNSETGGITARSRQTPGEAAADWIGNDHKNHWDGTRLLQHRCSWRRVLSENDVGPERDKLFRGSLSHLRVLKRAPAGINLDIAAFDPSQFLECLPECVQVILEFRVVLGMRHEHADATRPFSLLRKLRERPPSRHTTEKGNELAPPHGRLRGSNSRSYQSLRGFRRANVRYWSKACSARNRSSPGSGKDCECKVRVLSKISFTIQRYFLALAVF